MSDYIGTLPISKLLDHLWNNHNSLILSSTVVTTTHISGLTKCMYKIIFPHVKFDIQVKRFFFLYRMYSSQ